MHIPIRTYGKTMEAKLPSMKKLSSAAAADADGGVAMDRQYRSADDLSKEIPPEDRVKSYRYGKELFPVAPTDEALMKYEDEKCLQLLCFTSASKLPRECWGAMRRLLMCCVITLRLRVLCFAGHYFLSGVDVVVPEPDSQSGNMGVSALAHALHKTQRVAVVRYVKRKNAAPMFAVLTPCEWPALVAVMFVCM